MTRYIAQFHKSGFPDLYVVMEVISQTERYQIGDPKPYHQANDEADERNRGVFGLVKQEVADNAFNWLGGLTIP